MYNHYNQLAAAGLMLCIAALWRCGAIRPFNLPYFHRVIFTTLIVAVIVGFGYEIQTLLEEERIDQDVGLRFSIQNAPFESLKNYLLITSSAGIFVGGLTALFTVTRREIRFSVQLQRAILAFALGLCVAEAAWYFELYLFHSGKFKEVLHINRIAFSLVANIVGAIVGSYILFGLLSVCLKYFSRFHRFSRKYFLRAGQVLGGTTVFISLVLAAVYFSIAFRFSSQVSLTVRDWDAFVFVFNEESTYDGPPNIIILADQIEIPSSASKERITWGLCAGEPVCGIHLSDGPAIREIESGSLLELAAREVKPLRASELSFDAAQYNVAISVAKKRSRSLAFLRFPSDAEIEFAWRGAAFDSFFSRVVLDRREEKDTLQIRTTKPQGLGLMVEAREIGLRPKSSFGRDSDEYGEAILLLEGDTKFVISNVHAKTARVWSLGSRTIYLDRSVADQAAEISARLQTVEFKKPKFTLEHLGLVSSKVSYARSSKFEGTLKFANQDMKIERGDRIFLSGKDLQIRDTAEGNFRVFGLTSYVALNGEILNKTIWQFFPTEILAAFLAAAFAFAVAYVRPRRG